MINGATVEDTVYSVFQNPLSMWRLSLALFLWQAGEANLQMLGSSVYILSTLFSQQQVQNIVNMLGQMKNAEAWFKSEGGCAYPGQQGEMPR